MDGGVSLFDSTGVHCNVLFGFCPWRAGSTGLIAIRAAAQPAAEAINYGSAAGRQTGRPQRCFSAATLNLYTSPWVR
ncbi:MAG: hypothetical protein JWQ11_2982 [Rhizobacter sp.]|nr:hypothetical protein [Rhizobacter sp.]